MSGHPVLDVRGLSVRGPRGQAILDDVDLTLRAGEVTAIVGESGSGKTTLLNSILGLLPVGLRAVGGEVRIGDGDGVDLLRLKESERRRYLGTEIGYVPQDVRSGLNPLRTARDCVLESARRKSGTARGRADLAMSRAGLSDDFVRRDADRRPGHLSGGQCQRVLIAQAIVNEPRLLLMDEPTASLDPSTRREVQETIRRRADAHCAVCLVTHDVAALSGLADRIGVMYLGRIVEIGAAEDILARPLHPYTVGLLGCVPRIDRKTPPRPIPGEVPAHPGDVSGCKFHPRCVSCEERCRVEEPHLLAKRPDRKVSRHVVGTAPG